MPFKPLLAAATPGGKWLAALLGDDPIVALKGAEADELLKAGSLVAPGVHRRRRRFSRHLPPGAARRPKRSPGRSLTCLQATDDPSLLVRPRAYWREKGQAATFLKRRFEQPQERLLAALGYAARLFPPIEQSLQAGRAV